MEPWQTRVIAEKVELDDRINRLRRVLSKPEDYPLDLVSRDLMSRQLGYMEAYSSCLRDRIEFWRK